jgi:hypothetical protein
MYRAIAGLYAQSGLPVVSRDFDDIRDVPIGSLSNRKTGSARRDDVFGIQAGELPEQENQPEYVGQRSDDKLHQNCGRVGNSAVVRTANEDGRVGGDRGDNTKVQWNRPTPMRKRDGLWKLQHQFENERERHDDDENGEDQRGKPVRHLRSSPPNTAGGIHIRFAHSTRGQHAATGPSRSL